MQQTPQPQRRNRGRRKSWYRKPEIMIPFIIVSLLAVAAIVFNFPKIQHFIGLDYQNTTSSPTITTSTAKNTLQTLCDAEKAEDYPTQWELLSSTFQKTWPGGYDEFHSGLMHRDNSGGGVANCTVAKMIQNGSSGSGIVTVTFNEKTPPDTKMFLVTEDKDGVWRINDMLNA